MSEKVKTDDAAKLKADAEAKAQVDAKNEEARQKTINEMSDEELEKAQNAFLKRFYPGTDIDAKSTPEPAKEKAKTVEPEPEPELTEEEKKAKADEDAAKKAQEDEAKKKAEAEAAEKRKQLPPEIDEFTDQKKGKVQQPVAAEPDTKTETTPQLAPKEQRYLAVLEHMGKMNPEHKNLSKKHLDYRAKEAEYIKAWLKDNPGEKFNPNSEDHADWYAKNEVRVDPDEFELAKEEMLEAKVTEKLSRKFNATQKETENKKQIEKSQQLAANVAHNSVMDFLTNADEDVKGLVAEKDGMRFVPNEDFEMIKEKAPLVADVLMEEAEPLSIMTSEMQRMFMLPGVYEPDMSMTVRLKHTDREFPVHKEILNFVAKHEQDMLKKPAEETMKDGKRLVSAASFTQSLEELTTQKGLSDSERNRLTAELEKRYYILGAEDFRQALVEKFSTKAKSRIEKIRKQGVKFDLKKTSKEDKTQDPKPADKASQATDTQNQQASKRARPSTTTTSDRVDTGGSGGKGVSQSIEDAVGKMFAGLS